MELFSIRIQRTFQLVSTCNAISIFLLMTNIERNPDGMTRFGTIIRNNAQLMLHTHLKIVTGKIYDKDERYIILHGYHYRCYNFIKYT